MRLYQTPGGTWAGSEKEWKAAIKAEGLDAKDAPRRTVEIPTSKPELMEFLTFHNINVLYPDDQPALEHAAIPLEAQTTVSPATMLTLDSLFAAAPLRQRLDLATSAIDEASAQLV